MNDDEMAALEARLLNNSMYENKLFDDVEVDEEEGYFSSYSSAPRIDIDDEFDYGNLDSAWRDF